MIGNEILGKVIANPIFSDFTMDEVKEIVPYLQKIEVKAGMPLFREGEISDSMYFIVKGKIGIYKKTKDEELKKIAEISIGESVGELSIFDKYTRSATAIAETDVELLKLSRPNFERLEKEKTELAYKISKQLLKIISKRLRRTTTMLIDVLKYE